MLVMRTTEDPTHPLGKLVCPEQPIRLDDLALGVDPLRLDGVEPRTLLRKQAAHNPHSASTLLDSAVMPSEPSPHFFGDVPAGVVPDEDQDLLSGRFELLQAPPAELGGYGTHGPAVHESQPRVADLGEVEPVAGDGFRLGIVLGDRPLDEAEGLALLGPTVEGGQRHPAPPAFVAESDGPLGIRRSRDFHQPVAPPFFLSYKGSGEVIHRLARIHRTPSKRDKVARTVSPETRSLVSPSSKATSAAISNVQRLDSRPNSLGERWSISLKASADSSSKASRVRLGRESQPAVRASRPLSLKSFMASRAVCEAHPRFEAIFGARSPRQLARRIWARRMVKVSLERSASRRGSRSSSDNVRTKIGVFMDDTVTRQQKPILKLHQARG